MVTSCFPRSCNGHKWPSDTILGTLVLFISSFPETIFFWLSFSNKNGWKEECSSKESKKIEKKRKLYVVYMFSSLLYFFPWGKVFGNNAKLKRLNILFPSKPPYPLHLLCKICSTRPHRTPKVLWVVGAFPTHLQGLDASRERSLRRSRCRRHNSKNFRDIKWSEQCR